MEEQQLNTNNRFLPSISVIQAYVIAKSVLLLSTKLQTDWLITPNIILILKWNHGIQIQTIKNF